MTHDEMIAVIRAHASGAIIEGRNLSDTAEWQPIAISSFARFNFGLTEYRIKPEPPKPREWWIGWCDDGGPSFKVWEQEPPHGCPKCQSVLVREVLPDEKGRELWIIATKGELHDFHRATVYEVKQTLVPNQVQVHVREIDRTQSEE